MPANHRKTGGTCGLTEKLGVQRPHDPARQPGQEPSRVGHRHLRPRHENRGPAPRDGPVRADRRRHPQHTARPPEVGSPAHGGRPRHAHLRPATSRNHPPSAPDDRPSRRRARGHAPAPGHGRGTALSEPHRRSSPAPPAPGLEEAVRTARREEKRSAWHLYVTRAQAESIAYALWLEARAHTIRSAHRFAREYDTMYKPSHP
ncbi:DUF6417 family protein [Streptomyces sp. UNOB3_S3]|uniref:DUF6417 family protein n=1 Tax=Streptomyces sp. UNOB3_S3 TaxID=2871682 RepID=UPI0035AEBB6B